MEIKNKITDTISNRAIVLNFNDDNMLYTPIKDTNLIRLGNLLFDTKQNFDKYNKCDRSMQELADEVGTTRKKMFAFLRSLNLIKGTEASAEYIAMDYFTERQYVIQNPNFSKNVNQISVTPKGVKMIKSLIKLLNPAVI